MAKFCCLLLLSFSIVSECKSINDAERNAKIISSSFEQNENNYKYSFETSNGIRREESGNAIDDDNYVVLGSYAYTAPDGKLIEVKYSADAQGYRLEGQPSISKPKQVFPTPPPTTPHTTRKIPTPAFTRPTTARPIGSACIRTLGGCG